MMQILFTQRDLPLSRLIIKLTGEPVSHSAILHQGYVYQSDGTGVSKKSLETFISDGYKIILRLSPSTGAFDDEMTNKLITRFPKIKGSFYDIPALCYIGVRILLRDWFDWQIPKKNLWQISSMYICTEFVMDITNEADNPMLTPYQLHELMKSSGKWVDAL